MPNNEPRKIKALTVKGDAAENGGMPAGAAAPAKPDPLPDRRPRQLLRPSVAHRPPMPAPTHRRRCRHRRQHPIRRRRPVSPPPMPSRPLPQPAAIIWFRSPRRRTRPTRRPPTARCKTSFRPRWDPVRRSSSAPISAPRGSITAPWSARSDQPKRRPSFAAI